MEVDRVEFFRRGDKIVLREYPVNAAAIFDALASMPDGRKDLRLKKGTRCDGTPLFICPASTILSGRIAAHFERHSFETIMSETG
ncbi:MAG: hypothetical protein ACXV8O_17430 [Methylobacter sp.]